MSSIIEVSEPPAKAPRTMLARSPLFSISRPSDTQLYTHSSGAGYTLTAELPGVPASGVKVERDEKNRLFITATDASGEHSVLNKVYSLPVDCDPQSVRASCVDGLLRIVVEKASGQKPQQITVEDHIPSRQDAGGDDAYYITVNVPGMKQSELSAAVEDNGRELVFVLRGKSERGLASDIQRTFAVPKNADVSRAKAGVENGLFALAVPKMNHQALTGGSDGTVRTNKQRHEVAINEERQFNDQNDYALLTEDLPGMKPSNVKCEVRDDYVTLRGEVESQDDTMRSYRSVSRTTTLPEGASANAVKAQYADGQLRVYIPRNAIKEPQKETVQIRTDSHVKLEQ